MSDDFSAYIATTRSRIADRRRILGEQIGVLKTEIAGLDREEAAIKAYEAAKTGMAAPASGHKTRSRRVGRRQEIITALRSAPQGMKRGELLMYFGVKGDKSAEMSISNALSALTKTGQIARGPDGKYVDYAAPDMQAAAE